MSDWWLVNKEYNMKAKKKIQLVVLIYQLFSDVNVIVNTIYVFSI